MGTVFKAFEELEPYLLSREAFEAPGNQTKILNLLNDLGSGFHQVGSIPSAYQNEPGFVGTLKLLNDLLADSRNRFVEGKKGYALWRLRNAPNYCVSCHTRYEVPVNFAADNPQLATMNAYQRGEFLLATRQFDQAETAFMEAARTPPEHALRMDALRRWMLIYTRVNPKPVKAIRELSAFRREVALARHEREEIEGWLESLTRWRDESSVEVPTIRRAEHLIQQALAIKEPLAGRNGMIELLRATALLHRVLEDGRPEALAERARALRLLGVAYNELPFEFVEGLPRLFLEECIREYPNTEDARKAFQLYQHIVSLDYTGSAGTSMPAEVQVELRELYRLAYGVPEPRDQV